jgi:hypothetical protein
VTLEFFLRISFVAIAVALYRRRLVFQWPRLSSPINSKVYFNLTSRRRFFKLALPEAIWRTCDRWGFGSRSREAAPEVFNSFYIASDHPAFLRELNQNPELRQVLIDLKSAGCVDVLNDGKGTLKLLFLPPLEDAEQSVQTDMRARLLRLKTLVEAITPQPWERDPIHFAIERFELILVALTLYGVAAMIGELFQGHPPFHRHFLDAQMTAPLNKVAWVLMFGLWALAVFGLLRNSLRFPVILARSFFFLWIGISWGGLQIVEDLNRILDTHGPESADALIVQKCAIRVPWGGKYGHTQYSFILARTQGERHLPQRLHVSRSDFDRMTEGRGIRVTFRRGFLNSPYTEKLIEASPPTEPMDSPSPRCD